MCPGSYDLIRGHMLQFDPSNPEFKAEGLLPTLLTLFDSFLMWLSTIFTNAFEAQKTDTW